MIFRPVIFGGYVNGYSLARTFNETYNVESIICDYTKNIACYSKFCNYKIITNPQKNEEQFIKDVEKIGRLIRINDEIPILLVTNDIWLMPLSKYKNILQEIFVYTFSDSEIIDELANKNTLYELCGKIGVDYPKTHRYCIENKDFYQLKPPLLIKPSNVPEFINYFPNNKRNEIVSTIEEASSYLERIYSVGYQGEMIIQEYIPGGVENLYTCTTYSTQYGKVKGVSVGYKLSQYPENAGTITSGLIKYNEEVESLTKKILEHKKFFGIANTEFKFDSRDNTFKMIEVNARPGMWNYSTILSGVNLIEMLVEDILLLKEVPFSKGINSIIWSRISKKEVMNCSNNLVNKDEIKSLLDKGKIYDPLINKSEGYKFRIEVLKLDIKIYLAKMYNKWIKKGFDKLKGRWKV